MTILVNGTDSKQMHPGKVHVPNVLAFPFAVALIETLAHAPSSMTKFTSTTLCAIVRCHPIARTQCPLARIRTINELSADSPAGARQRSSVCQAGAISLPISIRYRPLCQDIECAEKAPSRTMPGREERRKTQGVVAFGRIDRTIAH